MDHVHSRQRRFRYCVARSLFVLSALAVVLLEVGCAGSTTANPANGNPETPTLTISNVAAATVTQSAATITWNTSAAANSQVEYGTTPAYGSTTALDPTMVTAHQEVLSGLQAATVYHYRVRSTDASNQINTSGDLTLTTAGDTTPPTVGMTAPGANATVSGTVTVSANATDNVAVASVQFQLDGANLGAAVTTAPYNLSWDTTGAANGTHTLRAVAKDTSNNATTSASVTVTVSNTTSTAMGPLVQSTINANYFVDPNGKAVLLSGSHTWN